MQQVYANSEFSTAARILLKEATALTRDKKYIEACDKLREAYAADGAVNLMIEDRLRLPMYLQLAGKNDDGWTELNRLSARYVDQFSRPMIANQLRIFLRKENNEAALNPVRVVLRGDNSLLEMTSASDGQTTGEAQMSELPARKTVGELQSEPMSAWGNDDIVKGLQFGATMQLRTPLRVLLRHGEIHADKAYPPPKIAIEPWEGFWLPVTKSFEDIALGHDNSADDIDRFRRLDAELASKYTIASDVGPILAEDYLPFLIAVRRIVETHDPIGRRIKALREMPIVADWQAYFSKHGGIEGIVQRFFPKFSNLPAGLDTPNLIAGASDETLLGIKGIGPAKLKAMRERCACITENRDADRVEDVIR